MKYGETFRAQSVPQWAPYNIDYNELKNMIKAHTTKDQAQAIVIPGQTNTALDKFEAIFFKELASQHDRVDLFVKSKADEISRRLQHFQKIVLQLLARCAFNNGKPISQKRRDRFVRYEDQIRRCGDDTRSLQRFVDAQRIAFHKILKKYKKWTGSATLGERFNTEVLGDPKSFIRRDFRLLLSQENDLLTNLQASTPDTSEPATPSTRSRRASTQIQVQEAPQPYWNEYINGSEAGDEPYTIVVVPGSDSDSSFPGSRALSSFLTTVKLPMAMEKLKGWLSPPNTPTDQEQRPLLGNGNGNDGGYFVETDAEEGYASSTDFPTGYAAHYATFPSVHDQKYSRYREQILFRCTVASLVAAAILLLIASILIATGKHKLRVEVDVGAIIGIVSSLFFATLGLGTMLYRQERLGWLHQSCVAVAFIGLCLLNGMLLVLVVGNSGL